MAAKNRVLSVEVEGPDVPGETKVRRSVVSKEIIAIPFPDEPGVNTVHVAFERSARIYGERPFLGHRAYNPDGTRGDYVWASFRQVFTQAIDLACGLTVVCGLQPKAPVGIYSINRPEWTTALFGLFSRSLVCVPLYDTLGASAVSFIINHSEVSVVLCEKSKLKNMLESVSQCSGLKHIVCFENVTEEEVANAKTAGVNLLSLSEICAAGQSASGAELAASPPTPADLAYIMYTSGTTGDPKGVLLTHQNLLASSSGLLRMDNHSDALVKNDDVYISYLPLAHSFETCLQVLCVLTGACIGFYQGDVRKLVSDDIPALRPTVMAGVPRVYSRVYDKITQGVQERGFFTKFMFDWAYSAQSFFADWNDRSHIWDAIVFNKMKEKLGGRVRLMATGAAPMSADLQRFLKIVFDCPVLQGYGMTENCAAAFAMPAWYDKNGTVGGVIPCTEFKLVDVEDMGYLSHDVYPRTPEEFSRSAAFKGDFDPTLAGKPFPRGEVWLRGANVFQGYYKLPKETEETLTSDGWLKTGDVGQINPDGSLSIIDRKKNIFKLAQGEYVAAEAVEQAISTAPLVMQVWIYGNSFKVALVAIVVPDKDVLMKIATEKGLRGDFKEIASLPEMKKLIIDQVQAAGKASKLKGFEFPKAVHIETEIDSMGLGFNVENDLLTPTMKLRRPQLLRKYQPVIDAMYATIPDA